MKIRKGFVSNSSSSSFVIVVKDKKKSLKSVLQEKLLYDETHPLYFLSKDVVDFLAGADRMTIRQLCEDYGDDPPDNLVNYLESGGAVYSGMASDDCSYDNPIEGLLCMTDLNYEDDDIIIEKEGGY